jgi:3-hydroxyisobutyrate dehydrogenase
MKAPRVGFIGLGAMGMGMARNLHAAGWLSIVWNRTRERAAALAGELGAAVAEEPTAPARAAECDRRAHRYRSHQPSSRIL